MDFWPNRSNSGLGNVATPTPLTDSSTSLIVIVKYKLRAAIGGRRWWLSFSEGRTRHVWKCSTLPMFYREAEPELRSGGFGRDAQHLFWANGRVFTGPVLPTVPAFTASGFSQWCDIKQGCLRVWYLFRVMFATRKRHLRVEKFSASHAMLFRTLLLLLLLAVAGY